MTPRRTPPRHLASRRVTYSGAHRARAPMSALGAVLLAVTSAAVVMFAAPQSAQAATRGHVLSSAYAYGHARGYTVGISVLDTRTGKLYHAGNRGTFASESVVKVLIGTRIFLQNRLHGRTRARVYTMITQSDDRIASSLYGSVGGDSLITWIKKRLHIPNLGSPPRRAGWWGNTHITSDGLVELYAKLKVMKGWGWWLRNAMRHATKHGSDGFYQWFGLKSANSYAAVKQGWGTDYDNWGAGADENTTGFVNNDRYAVAILARGPSSTYGRRIGSMLTATARRLLPHGAFPDDTPVVTWLSARSGRTAGNGYVTLHGHDLRGATGVLFGSRWGRSMKVLSSTSVSVRTPASPAGWFRVRIVTPHGTSSIHGTWFHYVYPPVVTALSASTGRSGDVITVSGRNFVGGRYSVRIGSVSVQPVGVVSPTSLKVRMPAGGLGTVDVQVGTVYGTSTRVPADRFTFPPNPVATSTPPPAPSAAVSVSVSAPSSSAPSTGTSTSASSSSPTTTAPTTSAPSSATSTAPGSGSTDSSPASASPSG